MTKQPSGGASAAKTIPGEKPYDADDFAQKYGIPPGEAKTIIKRYGPSRKKLDSYMAAREA